MQLTKWLHEPIWISKVKVIHWPWSRVIQIQHIVFFFFYENAWPIEAKFYVEPLWDVGTKVCSNGLGHMTKMAAMPIIGKNLEKKNHILYIKIADHLESWNAALGTRVLSNLFKWWRWDDLDIFYGKSKLVPCAFVWGEKRQNSGFF